jgi:tight adherence protein B
MTIIIIGIAAVITIGILIYSVIALRSENQAQIEARLDRYTTDYNVLLQELEAAEEAARQKRDQPSAVTKALDKAIEKRSFAQGWRDQLARADLKITPGEFLAAHFISVILGFFLGFIFLLPGNVVVGIAVGAFGFFVPRIYVTMRKGKRVKDFETQLPDTISLWVNGLRAGYSVQQAMDAIAREGPDPTSTEFARVVLELKLGISREDALEHLLNRMPSEDLDLIITAVNIQAEVGGNLAEILDVIGHVIRERIKLKGEVRVLTAQGRLTGYVVGGLPILLSGLLMLINPEYMGNLFYNQTCGWPMLFCIVALVGTGTAVIQKIVAIEI